MSQDTILIVEPDPDLLKMFSDHFTAHEPFKVHVARTGDETLPLALKYRPKLILLETQLPDKPGLAVFRELHIYPRTTHIPVMFLAGGTEILLRNQILSVGAYDFIQKPVDVAEISLRIRNALWRSNQEGWLHPDTRLPTGKVVENDLAKLSQQPSFYRLELTLAGYETFKDMYGFIAAKEVMVFAGNVICEVIEELGTPQDFIGHRQEPGFVVVTQPTHGAVIQAALQERLNTSLLQFYGFMDREQGYVEIPDGTGGQLQKPLMQLAIAVHHAE